MSYAYRGEKVFDYQNPKYVECGPPEIKRSDHRLKRFYSTSDRRAWDFCENVRYKHFYELMTGSQTCLNAQNCHQYVPLNDLINIITSERDARIRELEEMLRKCCGDQARANEAQERTSRTMQSDELIRSRDMLRQAMHKLQNIDEIINENKRLHCRLRCSEERVKYLEEKKKRLENELADLRSKSQIEVDLERTQQMLQEMRQRSEDSDTGEIAQERDRLQEKVLDLQRELEESRKKENEIEMLKKQSESDMLNMEEMLRENECYRKKLASMKCLEKQIQEIKKQGLALAEKYKRESQKSAEQMKKMCHVTKELQSLREERDGLLKRVEELTTHEGQFKALQCKLKRVEAIIAENEVLNNKLLALDKLEKENEYLKCRIDQIQEMEINAIEDKERIVQLQRAIEDQEEEMKDLLCQIERLTSGRAEEEMERLKCELYEKNSKLKLCEEQLAEIPMLEAEIDDLRKRLQCCCKEFAEKKTSEQKFQRIEVRLPSKSTGISARYKKESQKTSSVLAIRKEEKIDINQEKPGSCKEILLGEEKTSRIFSSPSPPCEQESMSCEQVQNLLQSWKGIISCVLEDMIEHHREMEDLELFYKTMKSEIENLKAQTGHSNAEECQCEIRNLKKAIEEKDLQINRLMKCSRPTSRSKDDLDVEALKELNQKMKCELQEACEELKETENLKKMLQLERNARCQAERMLKEKENAASQPGGKITEEDADFDCCRALQKEIDDLKLQIIEQNNLINELKKENSLLRELQQPCPDFSKELDEKCALENLLSLLQAELDAFKGQKLSQECEALRNELKRVLEQNCQLKILVDCYRQRLCLEKQSDGSGRGTADFEGKEKDEIEGEVAAEKDVESSAGKPVEVESGKKEAEEKKEMDETTPPEIPPRPKPEMIQPPEKETANNDLLDELNRLKKLLEEKDKALADQQRQCEDMLKTRENEMKKLQANMDKLNDENKALEKAKEEAPKTTGKEQEDCQKLLKELEQQNADKLKKLMEQHEREQANREKAYNDNLNAMKAGYETDIKKMAEKHKASIMKLQGLHEDEVKELNTNHETQLDTMQTQSEMAMNDIARGSAAKIKKLTQQHDKDMKTAEDEINKLQNNLAKSKEELEGLKNEARRDSEMSQMKEKHNKELQKMKKSSMRRLSMVTSKYEGLLAEEKRKSQAQLELLKKKEEELGGGACECSFAKKKPKKLRDPTCPLDFNEVLEKILSCGMDSLSFNEIALVHKKSCCALKAIVLKSEINSVLEPPVGEVCPDTPLLQVDKEQLLQRILALENEISDKQKETQEAILGMEVTIKKERSRLQELKCVLQNEQQKNSELKLLLTSQTKLETDLREERDRLASLHQSVCMENSKQLNREKTDKKCLEVEVDRLKLTIQRLCDALETERENSRCTQGKDSGYLQVIKSKLDQSVARERNLALQLENEVKCRTELQCQLQALRQSFHRMVSLPAVEKEISENPLEVKSAKEKKNLDQVKERKSKSKSSTGRKHKRKDDDDGYPRTMEKTRTKNNDDGVDGDGENQEDEDEEKKDKIT